MTGNQLEIVRQTKLDLAQWIASGIEQCHNPAIAISLARYAAAQLEAAAWIPAPRKRIRNPASLSLLRAELRDRKSEHSSDSTTILNRVSRRVVQVLLGSNAADKRHSSRDVTCVRLARHEVRAVKMLMDVLTRKAAA